ncbi:MAG: MBL fold metallo-hydrolase [Dehalococcoidia bacterium]
MEVKLWGTRGSHAGPGAGTVRYGGHTACVEVRGQDGTVLVIDAGTGAKPLGGTLVESANRVDILLSHLHLDHIQGLGFFAPLFMPGREVHIWGPSSASQDLRTRLSRYLSPPLFPIRLRDLPCDLTIHDTSDSTFTIGPFAIRSMLVLHPDATVGYRISEAGATMAYLSDHEPALGSRHFPEGPAWTSGFDLAEGVDLLIHDAQYTDEEYVERVGWGHSTFGQAVAFARLSGARHLVSFHHDPAHTDQMLDEAAASIVASGPPFRFTPGTEGAVFRVAAT